jgi:site-specific DNA-methyltransferase (adenine-specific)
MNWTDKIQVFNDDCMNIMAQYEDGHFDLAIVDPPYGIGASKTKKTAKRKGQKYYTTYKAKTWDSIKPNKAYFDELKRVSKNYIVWGGNYFEDLIGPISPNLKEREAFKNYMSNSKFNWLFWDKLFGEGFSFAAGELAFCSFNSDNNIFKYGYWKNKNNISNNSKMANQNARIHPTQKPVALYRWLLDKYAKPDFKILDTHLGSGSNAIACHWFGCELVAAELDEEYYQDSLKRFKRETAQQKMF